MYNILIVDDEAELRNGIANFFPWDELGFNVYALAADGQEALQYVGSGEVDVVLTDVVMPNMNGIELAKKLHEEYTYVKVLMLSGYAEFSYAQSAVSYGVREYILKPTKYRDLQKIFSSLKVELDGEQAQGEPRPKAWDTAGEQSPGAYHEKIIHKAKAFIRSNIATATLEDTAASVHLNPHYLSSLFKLRTGTRFSDYLLHTKMELASSMLVSSDEKIYNISLAVGYNNPNNFARAFKQVYHVTPRQYRNTHFLMGGRCDR